MQYEIRISHFSDYYFAFFPSLEDCQMGVVDDTSQADWREKKANSFSIIYIV